MLLRRGTSAQPAAPETRPRMKMDGWNPQNFSFLTHQNYFLTFRKLLQVLIKMQTTLVPTEPNYASCIRSEQSAEIEFPVWFEGLNSREEFYHRGSRGSLGLRLSSAALLINHTSSSRVQLPAGFLINHLRWETFITST